MEGVREWVERERYDSAVRCIGELFDVVSKSYALDGEGIDEFDYMLACSAKERFEREEAGRV